MEKRQKRWSSSTTVPGLADICSQGNIVSLLVLVLTVAIHGLQYWQIFRKDDRLLLTTISCLVASAIPGVVGFLGFTIKNGPLLALHIALTFMFGALLAFTHSQTHNTLNQNCHLNQKSFEGCEGCPCALSSSCENKDFKETTGCTSCDAWPTDICSSFLENNFNFASITKYLGIVVILLMSIPPVFSLVALIRIQSKKMSLYQEVEQARAQAYKELEVLESGNKSQMDVEKIKELTEFLMVNGKESDLSLVMRIRGLLGWNETDLEAGVKRNKKPVVEELKDAPSTEHEDNPNKKKRASTLWAWGRKENAVEHHAHDVEKPNSDDAHKNEHSRAPERGDLDSDCDDAANGNGGDDDDLMHEKKKKKNKKAQGHHHDDPPEGEKEHRRKSRKSSIDIDDARVHHKEPRHGAKDSSHEKHHDHEHGQHGDHEKPRRSKRASVTSETDEIVSAAQDDKRRGRRKERKSVIHEKGTSSSDEEVFRSERKSMRKKRSQKL